jgi:hypothetical protein
MNSGSVSNHSGLTASEDRKGCLVLVDKKLAAVLVRLSDQAHDPLLHGAWYFEAGFGFLDSRHELLASPKEAAASIEAQLIISLRNFHRLIGPFSYRSVRFLYQNALYCCAAGGHPNMR